MKNLLTALFLFSTLLAVAQEATSSIKKNTYKFDETIKVTFRLSAKYDSIQHPEFKIFKDVFFPISGTRYSLNKNGDTTWASLATYKLQATQSGELKIPSPIFFVNGQKIMASPIIILVESNSLTPQESNEIQTRQLARDFIKPSGTTRVVRFENIGYIETFNGRTWEFKRGLTPKEIRQLNRLK